MAIDETDRKLLAELQLDATQSYAALGQVVGMSAGATHERVRKLKAAGVIRRTAVEVDPAAVGQGVLAFVMLDADAWMGDEPTLRALAEIPAVQEAHIIAGPASVLVKVRTATTEDLQTTLRALHKVDGVTSTQTIVVLESCFERPPAVM
ncbi:Lrp/AsnC family transcriptional regulator [Kribbella capetownensis]|uniref:Lrp/AsnC family transcriptional regulator n=1 Tax=Kribbella capetownensis TaxID=1572659 RepID=A0A4R0JLU4_9ACTN|nr:Lrp/AsnC family transcriptional regulator [Kribbella capetownensis]TCC45818.1 Lrp/AsnC family transcriptional regulator [Kribbella capetownensis]